MHSSFYLVMSHPKFKSYGKNFETLFFPFHKSNIANYVLMRPRSVSTHKIFWKRVLEVYQLKIKWPFLFLSIMSHRQYWRRGYENSKSHAGHSVLPCWNIAGPNENQPDRKFLTQARHLMVNCLSISMTQFRSLGPLLEKKLNFHLFGQTAFT